MLCSSLLTLENQGAHLNTKKSSCSTRIPIIKIRRSHDCSYNGNPHIWTGHLSIEKEPRIILETSSVILTHWDRVTHICISNHTIIGSDNGLSPGRRQAIIWTNAGVCWPFCLGLNVLNDTIQSTKWYQTIEGARNIEGNIQIFQWKLYLPRT